MATGAGFIFVFYGCKNAGTGIASGTGMEIRYYNRQMRPQLFSANKLRDGAVKYVEVAE